MNKPIVFLLGIAVFFAVCCPAVFAAAPRMNVTVQGDHMTADLESVPLRTVLAGISQKTGIQVFIEKGLNGTITAKFSNLSLEDGMKRILKGYSNSMIFSRKDRIVSLAEVKVFEKGHDAGTTFDLLESDDIGAGHAPGSAASVNKTSGTPGGSDVVGSGSMIGTASPVDTAASQHPMTASVNRQHHMQLSRMRREMMEMRSEMQQLTDEKEKAALREKIAQKSTEIEKLEKWNQARIRGMERMQRRMAGHN